MSRRSGLGRGLAALIPPSLPGADPVDELAESDGDPPDPEPSSTAGPPSSEPSDPTGGAAEAAPSEGEPAPVPVSDATEDLEVPQDAAEGSAESAVALVETPIGTAPTGAAPERDPGRADRSAPAPGRELSELRGTEFPVPPQIAATAATLAEVAPSAIVANPRQPREVFDPDELAHLATSLADIGVLQPLVVRPLDDGRYELVAGERRLRAATLAGLATVPVVVRHTEDADLLKEALVENIHRVQLNPLEEGAAYQQLLEDFGVTQEELAKRLGRSRPAISNAIRLLQLPTAVQRRVASGVLSAGHAKVLLAIEDPDQQARLAERIVAEGMSVRATEELVRLRLLDQPGSAAAARRRPSIAPGLAELQDDLSTALEARVRISMGAKKGKLAIEFASVDDLERLVSVIANGLERGRGAPSPGRSDPFSEPAGSFSEPTDDTERTERTDHGPTGSAPAGEPG